MYLAQYISRSGVCSRRKAIDEIKTGNVMVNQVTITDVTYQVKPQDRVMYDDRIIKPESFVYLLFNKPKGVLTACSDKKRATVIDVINYKKQARLYPVGRLDKDTTGALVVTNDGDFAQQLAHPKYKVPKTYFVKLNKPFSYEDEILLKKGIYLYDGKFWPDDLFFPNKKNRWVVGLTIHSGKYRIVRRAFYHIGYTVQKLERVKYGPLTLKNLPQGHWREISKRECELLLGKKPAVKKKK